MPWARIDDKFYAHPKGFKLGKYRLAAIGLHVLAITWSCDQLTDGVLPEDVVVMLGGTPAVVEALIRAGMWHHSEERREYLIHDFDVYNKTRDQVEKQREDWRRRQGMSRGESRRDTNESHAKSHGAVTESRSRSRIPLDESKNGIRERGGSGGGLTSVREALEGVVQ